MNQKILFVSDSLFPLGPTFQLGLLANRLAQDGFEIHVAVTNGSTNQPHGLAPEVNVHYLQTKEARDLAVLVRLRKLVNRLAPTIVHSWGLHALSVASVALLATGQRQFATILELPMSRGFGKQFLGSYLNRNVRFVASHPEIVESLERTMWSMPSRKVELVANASASFGSDRQASRKNIRELLGLQTENPILIGAAAQWHQRTRLKDLIWAADLLCCIRDDVHLLLFGDGPQTSRLERFRSLTEATGNIHFPSLDVENGFAGLDIFWQSHLIEPEPSGALAAMATGIPTICVLGPGSARMVEHQASAFAVNFGARDEFARWSKYLIERPESAKEIGRQGKQHVSDKFKISTMVDGYRNIYQF